MEHTPTQSSPNCWHKKCFIIGFYGTANGSVVYIVGLEVAFAFPHFKHQFVWPIPQGEAEGSPGALVPGRQIRKETGALLAPLRPRPLWKASISHYCVPVSASCLSLPRSPDPCPYLTKTNRTAAP